MKKLGIGLAAALAMAVAGAPAANAADTTSTGPCDTQQALFEKYNIELAMHQEQVEQTYSWTCSQTG